jgi:hypothetical protein
MIGADRKYPLFAPASPIFAWPGKEPVGVVGPRAMTAGRRASKQMGGSGGDTPTHRYPSHETWVSVAVLPWRLARNVGKRGAGIAMVVEPHSPTFGTTCQDGPFGDRAGREGNKVLGLTCRLSLLEGRWRRTTGQVARSVTPTFRILQVMRVTHTAPVPADAVSSRSGRFSPCPELCGATSLVCDPYAWKPGHRLRATSGIDPMCACVLVCASMSCTQRLALASLVVRNSPSTAWGEVLL